ncbi:methyl-accepting chemotaxis protein, partial [Pseudoxanthomonas sp. SGD-10]
AGIEQVSQTVVQMDETTQQNAALVEEASAAARSMAEQAGQLVEAVAVFRLADGLGQSALRAPARVAPRPAARPTAAAAPRAANPAPAPVASAAAQEDSDWQEF